jgi:GT2 family glycosyltransferase
LVVSVIVSYNALRWIDKCISSLLQSNIATQVVLIDNASTDGTVEYVREKFTSIKIFEQQKNLGFGQANNVGLKYALTQNAEFVFLLNQDAWIDSNTLEGLIEQAKRNSAYAILSPFHKTYDGQGTEFYFNDFVIKHYTPKLLNDLELRQLDTIYETEFVHAACWLLPIKTLTSVGGFDPLFFHYSEDNDYVQRVRKYGLKIGVIPQFNVYHFGTNAALDINNSKFVKNRLLLELKNPAGSTFGVLLLFIKKVLNNIAKQNAKGLSNYLSVAKKIYTVIKSRKIQKKAFAYLK